MLDTVRKGLEKRFWRRFVEAICVAENAFPSQFGFREGSATVDAGMKVLDFEE